MARRRVSIARDETRETRRSVIVIADVVVHHHHQHDVFPSVGRSPIVARTLEWMDGFVWIKRAVVALVVETSIDRDVPVEYARAPIAVIVVVAHMGANAVVRPNRKSADRADIVASGWMVVSVCGARRWADG